MRSTTYIGSTEKPAQNVETPKIAKAMNAAHRKKGVSRVQKNKSIAIGCNIVAAICFEIIS